MQFGPKTLPALVILAALAMTPAWAETGRPDPGDGPDARETADMMEHPGVMDHPGMMEHSGMMGQDGHRGWRCAEAGDHVEGRLGYLRTELHITAAEESLWQAYATATRDAARSMAEHCKAKDGTDTASLQDRLDRHMDAMAARLDAMRATTKALRPLYAALDASQKKAADEMMGPSDMMRAGGRR